MLVNRQHSAYLMGFKDIEALTINTASTSSALSSDATDVLELANGCLCCSIKDTGVAAIEALINRKREFDYIVLETTGMADPGPIAMMFWQNEEYQSGIGRNIQLDGVVCVVDGVFGEKQLLEDANIEDKGESVRQVACADVVILNKIDCVSHESLSSLESMIRSINPLAPIHRTTRGNIAVGAVLNLHSYESAAQASASDKFWGSEHPHQHAHDEECEHSSAHYEVRGVSSLTLDCPPLNNVTFEKMDAWIRTVLWDGVIPEAPRDNSIAILRCKGIFYNEDTQTHHALQGVQTMYEFASIPVDPTLSKLGKLVLIGRGLTSAVESSFVARFGSKQ